MSILGDFEDFKNEWSNKGIGFKCIALFSFYLTISSVASLSNTIFEWKGFILEGIEFYHKYVSNPIRYVAKAIGISLSKFSIDFLIAFNLFTLPFIKHVIQSNRKSNRGYNTRKVNISRGSILLLPYIVTIFIVIFFGSNEYVNTLSWIVGYYVMVFIVIVLALIIIEYFNKQNQNVFQKMYTPIILGIIFILVLAAINTGLNK